MVKTYNINLNNTPRTNGGGGYLSNPCKRHIFLE